MRLSDVVDVRFPSSPWTACEQNTHRLSSAYERADDDYKRSGEERRRRRRHQCRRAAATAAAAPIVVVSLSTLLSLRRNVRWQRAVIVDGGEEELIAGLPDSPIYRRGRSRKVSGATVCRQVARLTTALSEHLIHGSECYSTSQCKSIICIVNVPTDSAA